MKQNDEQRQWDKFYRSGSVSDYLAYRQFVNRNSATGQRLGEVTSSAADHRGNSDKGNSFR